MKLFTCLLCALISASAVLAFPTPSKQVVPQCVDPTFACQDLESARLCGVVKSCIHDIWATMGAPDDNDEICDICKEMVKEARDQLLSNMTQEEIKEVFEGSCKLLPVKLIADGCIKVVDEIIPELVEMLSSRMDPNMVCTVSGLCNMAHLPIENHILKYFRMVLTGHGGDECSECTLMMTEVKTFLNTTSEADVKTYVEKICAEKVPAALCDLLIGTYFPQIYSYIISSDPKTMCSTAGICPQICNPNEPHPKVKEDLVCEFCEHVLEHVKQMIITNTTMEEFRTALLNFCKHMGSASDKCTSLVNDYYDMLFDYIKKLDTKGACTLIGLCTNYRCTVTPLVKIIPALETRNRIPLVNIQPAVHIPANSNIQPLVKISPSITSSKKEMQESNEIFQTHVANALPVERFEHPILNFERDTECAFCRAISFYLKQDLNGDRSKAGVKQAISNVCDKWVKDFPEHCQNFLNKYTKKVEYAIAEDIEFEGICTHVKACPLEHNNSELNVKVVPKVQSGPLCDLCKDLIGELETQLKDPATKQKVETILNQYCNLLPQALRDDCTNFVNQNIDALFNIIEQELNPDNVCPALGLCASAPRVDAPQNVKDMECDICKDLVSTFRQRLQDPGFKQTIQTFLDDGCARLPASLAPQCKTFVDQNIDTVIGIIIQELDPDTVCSILKICTGSVQKVKPQKLKNVECDLCKQVVQQVDDLVKDKKTEDEIKAALDKVCSYLPSSMTAKCQNFVNQYINVLITLIAEELDPEMVCAELKLCPGSVQKVKPQKFKDVECDLCEQVVQQVVNLVKDKKTEDEIKAALDKVCSYLPSSMTTKCQNFVNQYTDLLITLIAEEMDPEMVCAALNLCPGSVRKVKPQKFKDVECDLCKEVVGKVEDMVKDKKTEDEIKAALDKVCSYLPSTMADKCQNFVNQYVTLLITLITEEMDPQMVCAELQLCPAKDMECQTCQYALHFLQEQLQTADTQAEIKNVLKKMCTLLPDTYATNCDAFVDEYGSAFLALLAQQIDPSTLCWKLQMCSNQTRLFSKLTQIQLRPLSLDECSVCTTVVDYLDKLLEEDDVDKEITQLIEKVCTVIPASYAAKCSTIIETYGPYILQMIGQVADSKQVCQDIDLCPTPAGHVHLLGGHKCTFGPSYWCTTAAHAAACKAEMFCKQKVWKQ